MKKRKLILGIAICGICVLVCMVVYIIKYIVPFEVERKIIYQYEDTYERDSPSFQIVTVEYLKELCLKSDKESFKELENLLGNVDSEKYNILIIQGGKLDAFRMRLDHSLSIPQVKYSKNDKCHVEYYMIKNNRWIDQEVQFCDP